MSSLLFDWYANALSVCLVLVVNLLRQHVVFLLLLPNHLAYKSKVNAHSFVSLSTLFLLTLTSFSVFCCLVGRAADAFRKSEQKCSCSKKLGLVCDSDFTFSRFKKCVKQWHLVRRESWTRDLPTKLQKDHRIVALGLFRQGFLIFRAACMWVWENNALPKRPAFKKRKRKEPSLTTYSFLDLHVFSLDQEWFWLSWAKGNRIFYKAGKLPKT